jgi:streptogramin lyase
MFIYPHAIITDKDGNIWVVDGQPKDGRGNQVFKLSPDGKVLMTLGKAGQSGTGLDVFNQPTSVAIAPNGDIFVAEGHAPTFGNSRIMKFDKNGKFIMTFGHLGPNEGEFRSPHVIAFDSQGRLFVADRSNNRIEIFDQDGNFIDQWRQFSRPSGIFIDKHDVIYVADSESNSVRPNPGFKRGMRVGSAKDGSVTAFIPDPVEVATTTSAAEGVAVDSKGAIYGAEVANKDLKKYVKK